MGIAAVRAVGVYHSRCGGKRLLAFMVVGNNQVNPQLPAQLRLIDGGDTAVHGDDQLDALVVKLVDGDGVQAVALLQTAGNVAHRVGRRGGGENPSAGRWR